MKERIVRFVTTNKKKIDRARRSLAPLNIEVVQEHFDMIEGREEEPILIAADKAKQAWERYHAPVIVEDSGFFIRALGGFPKTHIKFSLSTLGIENILKMLAGVEDRHAEWSFGLVFVGPDVTKSFTYLETGAIVHEPRPVVRETGSDYWRIFAPQPRLTNSKVLQNVLTLSEVTEDHPVIQALREQHARENHFRQFGEWLLGQS